MSSYYMGGGGNVSGSYGYTFGFINVSTFDSYSQSQSQRNSKIQPKIELSL